MMGEKTGLKIFLEHTPALTVWYNLVLLYSSQFMLFLSINIFFWWISSKIWYGVIITQIIISYFGVFPYKYMTKNIEKIRVKYREKYGKLAVQRLWFHYQSYTIPLLSSSMYFPILLYNHPFLPSLIKLPPSILSNSLLPSLVIIPMGVAAVIFGLLLRRPSGGFDADIETYIYLMYPENGRLVVKGIYQYIRNPRYLGGGCISIGFGIIANNILAIILGFIHFLAFVSLLIVEDRELLRRFGDDFRNYQKSVPALFPHYGKWGEFIKFVFVGEKK